jgi:hypothetical protein
MFAAALVVLTLSSPLNSDDVDGLVPGDGVALDPVPTVAVPLGLPEPPGRGSRSTVPLGVGAVASVALVGAGVVSGRRRQVSIRCSTNYLSGRSKLSHSTGGRRLPP